MNVISIIVYNRYENLQHWISCWNKCYKDATLVVIHTGDEVEKFRTLCMNNNVIYIHRENKGYDIGCFQEVCKGTLKGFPRWEYLLWCTDDTFPMCTDFFKKFPKQPGVSCMELSPYVRTHIRTTGFMIDRNTARKLVFPADPIITKEHCYDFEHRSVDKSFYQQVINMRLPVEMVAHQTESPLWDVGYHRKLNRRAEHEAIFGECPVPETLEQKEKTTFVCPIYRSFPAVISSLIMQTNPNWELWLIHDGPGDGSAKSYINALNDDRVKYFESDNHGGKWGHYIRAEYLQKVTSKYVVITNPDNYYMPTFIEKCLSEFVKKSKTVAVYPAQIVHSYTGWKVMNCRVQRGYLDCGGVMLKTSEAKEVGWNNISDHSADWFFFNDVAAKYGVQKFAPIPGVLFVHN